MWYIRDPGRAIPLIKDKAMEMNHIYAKADKFEVCSLH